MVPPGVRGVVRLTPEAYAPFGDVVCARGTAPRVGNQGRAHIWDRLASLQNLRADATPNVSVFRTAPLPGIRVRLLERHPSSTQLFVPMNASRYLVVVARELGDVHGFVAGPDQAVTYHPGVWHHPLVALDREADFVCVVWEDGSGGDCEIVEVEGPSFFP